MEMDIGGVGKGKWWIWGIWGDIRHTGETCLLKTNNISTLRFKKSNECANLVYHFHSSDRQHPGDNIKRFQSMAKVG